MDEKIRTSIKDLCGRLATVYANTRSVEQNIAVRPLWSSLDALVSVAGGWSLETTDWVIAMINRPRSTYCRALVAQVYRESTSLDQLTRFLPYLAPNVHWEVADLAARFCSDQTELLSWLKKNFNLNLIRDTT